MAASPAAPTLASRRPARPCLGWTCTDSRQLCSAPSGTQESDDGAGVDDSEVVLVPKCPGSAPRCGLAGASPAGSASPAAGSQKPVPGVPWPPGVFGHQPGRGDRGFALASSRRSGDARRIVVGEVLRVGYGLRQSALPLDGIVQTLFEIFDNGDPQFEPMFR
jgi:hypothetical protein